MNSRHLAGILDSQSKQGKKVKTNLNVQTVHFSYDLQPAFSRQSTIFLSRKHQHKKIAFEKMESVVASIAKYSVTF